MWGNMSAMPKYSAVTRASSNTWTSSNVEYKTHQSSLFIYICVVILSLWIHIPSQKVYNWTLKAYINSIQLPSEKVCGSIEFLHLSWLFVLQHPSNSPRRHTARNAQQRDHHILVDAARFQKREAARPLSGVSFCSCPPARWEVWELELLQLLLINLFYFIVSKFHVFSSIHHVFLDVF